MKNKKKSIGIIALLMLVGATSGYVASTYAKYTSTVSGEGSAVVAAWKFEDDNANTNFDINLAENYDASTLVDERIAPGTTGDFTIALSNENSEVGVEFTIVFTETENVPQNLVFKQNGTTVDPTTQKITGYIAAGETLDVPLSWEWAYYTSDANDVKDTTDGKKELDGRTMTVNASITGIQVPPSTTAITTGITGVSSIN